MIVSHPRRRGVVAAAAMVVALALCVLPGLLPRAFADPNGGSASDEELEPVSRGRLPTAQPSVHPEGRSAVLGPTLLGGPDLRIP